MPLYFKTLFTWLFFFTLTLSQEILNIEFSNLSYDPLTSYLYPHQGWTATFDFEIPDTASIQAGDHFEVNLDRVYRVKFDSSDEVLTISLEDGTNIFKCVTTQQAAYIYDESIITCVAVEDLSKYELITGSMSFALNFNSGDSNTKIDLINAKFFHDGEMEVPINQYLAANITFDASSFSSEVYSVGRSTTYNSLETYYLGMECKNGFLVGGSQVIDFDSENKGFTLNCTSPKVFISKKFNDWWFPTDFEDTEVDTLCFGNTLKVTVGELEPDYKLWINALQYIPEGEHTIVHDVSIEYTCSDTMANTQYSREAYTSTGYVIYQGVNAGIATDLLPKPAIISTTTTGWTGSYTTTYSTEVTSVTGTDGSTTPETIYYVETPSFASFSNGTTIKEIYTQSLTAITSISTVTTTTINVKTSTTTTLTGEINSYISVTSSLLTTSIPSSTIQTPSSSIVIRSETLTSSVFVSTSVENHATPVIIELPSSTTMTTTSSPYTTITLNIQSINIQTSLSIYEGIADFIKPNHILSLFVSVISFLLL